MLKYKKQGYEKELSKNRRLFFCNSKDLVTLMCKSFFLLHKYSAKDTQVTIRQFTAKWCCSGAQSGMRPTKLEGKGKLKWARPLYFK